MSSHFTLRMAWHDDKWNGMICRNPQSNYYCTGSRSLLSDRIARRKNEELEIINASQKLDSLLPNYIPPCFWSCSAFSSNKQDVVHDHPFRRFERTKIIEEELNPYSMFSWPFRISFNHSGGKYQAQGSYPRDLTGRINRFLNKFEPEESIVFFYLNYDNPISGDEERYALVGCAVVNERPDVPPDFKFTEEELAFERNAPRMKNFPAMRWAVQVSYDFEGTGIRLPYHEYLEHIKGHPEDSHKLEEIKLLINEKSLVFGFKYVMADIDEDQCIYLLTKLKRAVDIIQEHGIIDFSREQDIMQQLLDKAWKRRDLYPGLSAVLNFILEEDSEETTGFVKALQDSRSSDEDLCEKTFSLVLDKSVKIPPYLKTYEFYILALRKNITQHSSIIGLLKKLTLFTIKQKQIKNIVLQNKTSFPRGLDLKEAAVNPYLLCEEYRHQISDEDLDNEEMEDGPIDLFKIDIGMFPGKPLKFNPALQDIAPAGPERLRAIIINYLYSIGLDGHCYSDIDDIYKNILDYPLFYKRDIVVSKTQLLEEAYREHFNKRLDILEHSGEHFFYLEEVRCAEKLIRDVVTTLLNREEYQEEISAVPSFIEREADALAVKGIEGFDREQFVEERTRLLSNILKRSFYVISGKPGSGKTKVIEKILNELISRGEETIVLAPTGKAAIRLKLECKAKNAQTIDRFIWGSDNSYRDILSDFALILNKQEKNTNIENLIIDESSMVDLQKLAALFSMIDIDRDDGIRRIIMVGDENQLPPIGFGKPFYDIIQHIKLDVNYVGKNFCKLMTNCRQETDIKITEFADIFTEKNRYYNELLDDALRAEGDVSKGLAIERWSESSELISKIQERLDGLFSNEIDKIELSQCQNKSEMLNLLFGLYKNGFVKQNKIEEMGIENFQILTPYRTEVFGTMALNKFVKLQYPREHFADSRLRKLFNHSDKVIRLSNEYIYDRKLKRRVLRLSNGSIGVINNKKEEGKRNSYYRMYYFTDQEKPIFGINEEEDFELAYAITVHKSQGSDFGNVFLVIPSKRTLLCKELLYTALTRSKSKLVIFLQSEEGKEVLDIARGISEILHRNSSIFESPENAKELFAPEKGIGVRSKIEYIIYKTLKEGGLDFKHEEVLYLEKGPEKIKPDFTIKCNNKTYYWEHLGELDLKSYWTRWVARKDWYKANGKYEELITTDDLGGVVHERILKVINDIKSSNLVSTEDSKFSGHHYQLYG